MRRREVFAWFFLVLGTAGIVFAYNPSFSLFISSSKTTTFLPLGFHPFHLLVIVAEVKAFGVRLALLRCGG